MSTSITTDPIVRIRTLAAELDSLRNTALEKANEAGKLLRDTKAELPHGEFLPWIEANFTFTGRTARRWMRISEDIETGKLKTDTVSNLTEAYHLTTTPKIYPKKSPFTIPTPTQRLILTSPEDGGEIAVFEPIDDLFVRLSYTDKDEVVETRRGVLRDRAWQLLLSATTTNWSEFTPVYTSWNPDTDEPIIEPSPNDYLTKTA